MGVGLINPPALIGTGPVKGFKSTGQLMGVASMTYAKIFARIIKSLTFQLKKCHYHAAERSIIEDSIGQLLV